MIAARSEALSRFMAAYARLARLPRPSLAPVDLAVLARRVAGLELRLPVAICSDAALSVAADADQLEQLLINLVSNAVDAALETGGGVRLAWAAADHAVELTVEDDGPGLSETANLFVPFYTTKPQGSGIGLVLSRQIAEAHGGSLTLENRRGVRGYVTFNTLVFTDELADAADFLRSIIAAGVDAAKDILLKDGRVAEIAGPGKLKTANGAEVLDA